MLHFYMNNYPTGPNKLAIVKPKLALWCILITFPYRRGSFALSVDVFKNIYQKLKSVNVYEM